MVQALTEVPARCTEGRFAARPWLPSAVPVISAGGVGGGTAAAAVWQCRPERGGRAGRAHAQRAQVDSDGSLDLLQDITGQVRPPAQGDHSGHPLGPLRCQH